MPRIEFVGQSARDADNPAGNPSRLVNGYREPMVPGGRAPHVLRAVPGMADFAAIANVFMRSIMAWNGLILAIVGGRLYSVTPTGIVALLGNVEAADDIAGLSQSTGVAVAVANRKYWTWNGTTLANVATGAISSPASVAYLGGYVIVSQFNGRTFGWSGLANPSTWSGLDFASAEITDEPIIRLITFKDALYIFKASGFERWAVTGQSGPDAFQRIGGAQEEPGLAGYNLIVTFPNGFAWVATDGRVYLTGAGPISTPPLEVALARFGPERMFYYEVRGHGFICIVFETGTAWCFDVATGEWHERDQDGGPWQARASLKFNGAWYVGTDSGQIGRLADACQDFGMPMVRRYVSRTADLDGLRRLSKVEAFPRIAGDIQGAGDLTDAKVTLRTSRDGITFGSPKPRGVGPVGDYDARLVWRELGQFRRATIELSQSSVVDVPLLSEIDVKVV